MLYEEVDCLLDLLFAHFVSSWYRIVASKVTFNVALFELAF